MTAVSAAALILRRLRTERGIVLLLFVLVASTSFLFAAAPRLFNRVTDDAVRYAVSTADTVQRDVFLSANGTIGAGTDPGVAAIQAYGAQREADFPASIQRLISDQRSGVTSVRFAIQPTIIGISLRYQDGIIDASRLTDGRWPVDVGAPLQQVAFGHDTGGDQAPPAVFEAALSTAQAEAIGAHVGDHLTLSLDSSDSLLPKTAFAIAPAEVEIVGLYEPIDPDADVWVGSSLLQPGLKQGPDGVAAIYATALMAPEAYPRLAAAALPFHYDWRYEVDASRLDADQVDGLQQDLSRLNLVIAPTDSSFMNATSSVVTVDNVTVGSGLPRILNAYVAQRARSESILSIAALGPLVLAAGATAMLAVLLVRRRRTSLLLARGRGASGRLLLGAQLFEALVVTGIAAVVGLLLAIYVVPARDAPLSPVLAVVVAGVATLLLVAATWPVARRPLIQLERDDPPVLRVPARRLVIEGTVVVIAVAAVVLLRQRGLTLGDVGATAQFDPLLAAVPLLIGLAAGILALRLFPLPVRGLGRIAARRRDFVPVVGLRTVARHPSTSNLPLLVLMLTAAFAAFASVISSSIDRGQVAASYLAVGADYRIERVGIGGLPPQINPTDLSGVQAVATGVDNNTASLVMSNNQRATIDLDAVDTEAYSTVTAGTAAYPAWPRDMVAPPTGTDMGGAANPIPAILSTQVPPALGSINIGDTFVVNVAQRPLIFRLVGRQASFPGHGTAATFAIVPIDWYTSAVLAPPLLPSVMWLRASSDATAPLEAMASTAPVQIRIVSRQDAYALLHDSPLGSAVSRGFAFALGIALVYLVITLVGAVVMSASSRTRDLAYLRTLGVSRRQALALTAVEQSPSVLLSVIPGVLLGVALALLVEPGLGLADFVGAQGLPLVVDWRTLVLIIVALSVVVIVAIAAGTWLAVRERLASALRIEES